MWIINNIFRESGRRRTTAMEATSTPLLQKAKSLLLEAAGSLTATNPLPTLEELVVNAGYGPLRCHNCRASLLLGPNSRICAASGTPRDGAASCFRMSFASTLAYQLLTASLQQQGLYTGSTQVSSWAKARDAAGLGSEGFHTGSFVEIKEGGLHDADLHSPLADWPKHYRSGLDLTYLANIREHAEPRQQIGGNEYRLSTESVDPDLQMEDRIHMRSDLEDHLQP